MQQTLSRMIILFFVFQINFIVLLGSTHLAGTFDKMEETPFLETIELTKWKKKIN